LPSAAGYSQCRHHCMHTCCKTLLSVCPHRFAATQPFALSYRWALALARLRAQGPCSAGLRAQGSGPSRLLSSWLRILRSLACAGGLPSRQHDLLWPLYCCWPQGMTLDSLLGAPSATTTTNNNNNSNSGPILSDKVGSSHARVCLTDYTTCAACTLHAM